MFTHTHLKFSWTIVCLDWVFLTARRKNAAWNRTPFDCQNNTAIKKLLTVASNVRRTRRDFVDGDSTKPAGFN